MKKIITMAFLAATVLSAAMTFTSCSNDNDDNNTPSVAVNSQKVFTGGLPKRVAGMTIQANEKGQVISIDDDGDKVTFKYKEATTRSTASVPDVVMTQGDDKQGFVCNLYLNKDGFVSHCDETEYDQMDRTKKETWDFTYNNEGQLLTMQRSEGENEKTTVKYQDGNIVEITITSADDPEVYSSGKVYYTSQNISLPIENKGCIMLFDETFGIDMDEMTYAYYAGLLGKATKNLPVRVVSHKNDIWNFSWSLNSTGYPTSFKNGEDTFSFSW